jgi:hypothetical protein
MKKIVSYALVLFVCSSYVQHIQGYGLPLVNLGGTSFLDGGPLRIEKGFYWQQFFGLFHARRFTGPRGKDVIDTHSLHLNTVGTTANIAYQSNFYVVPRFRLGFDVTQYDRLGSGIQKNRLGIVDAGAGLGDLLVGIFFQSDPLFHNGVPRFIHRFEFNVSFPIGEFNDQFPFRIYAGNGFYFIDPYWSATLYCTEKFSISWRLYYLWNSQNKRLRFRPGDAIHVNYAVEWWIFEKLLIGINGYYVQQLHLDKMDDIELPDTKERLFAIGPGFLYTTDPDFKFAIFGNFYVETNVRNRPQGVNFILRFFKKF